MSLFLLILIFELKYLLILLLNFFVILPYHQPRGMLNYFNSVRLKNLYNKNENNPHATKQTKNNKDKV